MNRFILISLFLLFSSYLFAQKQEKLVWPPLPDQPRIEHIAIAKNSITFGVERGFFSRIYDFLVGEDDVELYSPFGIHAQEKKVYVTDISSKSVYMFDRENEKTVKINGSKDETFLYPVDVVSDSKGRIFVSDSIRAKVYVFDGDGDFEYVITSKDFQRPVGLAINNKLARLYIVDAVANKIHVTSLDGKPLYSIGRYGDGDVEFNRPTFIDIDDDGNIYVSDSMNHRIQIIGGDGKFIHKFGKLGQNIGSFGSPRGISLDKENNIYVSDTMFNTIQIFNTKGELLMVFGRYGGNRGEFALAEDISILKSGAIFVSDTNNKRVQVFKLLDLNQKRSLK